MVDKKFDEMWTIMKQYKFEFENSNIIDLKCVICSQMLINACNGPCGCRYCIDCIDEYLRRDSQFCPGDTKECREETLNISENIQADRVPNMRISRLRVKCPAESCGFIDELRNIGQHIRICIRGGWSCPFVAVGCLSTDLPDGSSSDHLASESLNHSRLLLDWLGNLRNEIESVQKENSLMRTEIETLQRDRIDMNKRILKLESEQRYQKTSTSLPVTETHLLSLKNNQSACSCGELSTPKSDQLSPSGSESFLSNRSGLSKLFKGMRPPPLVSSVFYCQSLDNSNRPLSSNIDEKRLLKK